MPIQLPIAPSIFSINNDAYKGAIDRFSHFFIDPLFHPSSIGRELHAVDQEHAKNIEHDGWRGYMILKRDRQPDPSKQQVFQPEMHRHSLASRQEALKEWYQTALQCKPDASCHRLFSSY